MHLLVARLPLRLFRPISRGCKLKIIYNKILVVADPLGFSFSFVFAICSGICMEVTDISYIRLG